ncbi:related to Tripeptidyl-peptidase sed3 [Phialocephala subalpina]|uniref:tripeptidyl-peptidase II n=1 Tax=Phialocephala subalpina TaxID=576137 RepID=A0A1L7WCE0_9HELO|nr:related to Tripeptidyl-peptidase sed3 [Phialocephala subalpina]
MKFSLVALIVGTAVASKASLEDYQVFESLSVAPTPWVLQGDGKVDADQSFKLRVHLKNRNIAKFQQQVLDVSTPDHPSYGRHLSQLEINNFIAPPKESYDLTLEWLESMGLAGKSTVENDWVILDGTIGDAEKLLQTEYQLFENTETGKTTVRVLEYSIPAALHAYVDIIAPTIKFSTPSPQISTIVKDFEAPDIKFAASSVADVHDGLDVVACNSSITPDCIKALYKFKHFRGSRRNGNEIALAGFLEEYAQHDDLAQFLATYEPTANGSDFKEVLINGGLNLQDSVSGPQSIGEANLDIQYGLALAYPTPSTYYSTGGRPPETTPNEVDNEPYLEFLTYLLKLDKIPQTISISYGDGEWTVPESYAHTVCDLFAQVAARGVSVLVSSGDSGSGSNCNVTDPGTLLYTPAFPASCPFVTAVGATYHVVPEIAVSFSGGGFSNYFPRPSYQDAAVSSYLANHANATFKQYYNQSGRAYPDVSAQGVYFHTILSGSDKLLSGTSASSPAFAGVVALLNCDRISNGLPPFGLLNPWLYSKASSALTDIVGGKGSGCAAQIPGSGFPAVVGWDPVTGLGTPDFKKLRLASTGIES